jgi:hypothetical protein
MTDIEDLNNEILRETGTLAGEYAARFPGDPDGELRAWLHIAVRREAMVSCVYQEAKRIQRLPEPHVEAGKVAWDALTLIWQQEAVHTTLIEVKLRDGLLRDAPLSADLDIWQGSLEGTFLTALTGRPGLRQVLSKLAISFGALLVPSMVPDFARELSELDLREFFLLCSALETTARQCYARMETLAASITKRLEGDVPSPQFHSLTDELQRATLEETFHEAAFQEMAGWVVNGQIDPSLPPRPCAKRLLDLLPRPKTTPRDGLVTHVLTDGGLGTLFREHNLAFKIE